MGGIALALGGYRAVEIVLPGFALIGAPVEGRAQIMDEA